MATYSIDFGSADGTDVATHNAALSPTGSGLVCNASECFGAGIVLHSATLSGDAFIECVVRNVDTNNIQGYLHLKATSALDAVVAMYRANRVIVYDYIGSTNTNVSTTIAAGDTIRLEVAGTTATFKVNGTTVATLAGITRTGTKFGFGGADAASRLDSVVAGDLVSGPAAPTAGAVSSISSSGATANWTDASSTETGFKVQVSASPYSTWTTVSGSPAAANATSLSISGLSPATAYKFRVAATDGASDSAWSTSAEFTTSAALTKKLKLLAHLDALGASAVKGSVFAAPTSGNLVGALIGHFSGAAFGLTAESGKAPLVVAVAAFGGGALSTSDTPVCVFEATSAAGSALGAVVGIGSVGVHECTVIEE